MPLHIDVLLPVDEVSLSGCKLLVLFCASQRRFPAELLLKRYGQVVLLTCCSTLSTEADKTVHALLQEVLDDVLQLVEVADDPASSLHDFLKTVSEYGTLNPPAEPPHSSCHLFPRLPRGF